MLPLATRAPGGDGLRRQQLLLVDQVEEAVAQAELARVMEARRVGEPPVLLLDLLCFAQLVVEHLERPLEGVV